MSLKMSRFTSPHYVGNPPLAFTMDKEGSMSIPPKALNIVWGNDTRYWKLPGFNNKPVELCQVSWLEVTGSVDLTSPDKDYEVSFLLSLNQDAFGWGSAPIYIMIKRGKEGKFAWRKYDLNKFINAKDKFQITVTLKKSEKSEHNSSDPKLYFGMYEVWSGKWKGGLKIHQVFLREYP